MNPTINVRGGSTIHCALGVSKNYSFECFFFFFIHILSHPTIYSHFFISCSSIYTHSLILFSPTLVSHSSNFSSSFTHYSRCPRIFSFILFSFPINILDRKWQSASRFGQSFDFILLLYIYWFGGNAKLKKKKIKKLI